MDRLDTVDILSHDLARDARDERVRRDYCVLLDHGACRDNRAASDLCPCENNGTHADQHVILDLTAVNACAVSDRHIVADDARVLIRDMQTREILDVRTDADRDIVNIAACSNPRPEARVLSEPHITREEHLRRDERLLVNLRRNAVKGMESVSFECKHSSSFQTDAHNLFYRISDKKKSW